jgi:hypothetical protein
MPDYMKRIILFTFSILLMQGMVFAQKKNKKCNEGCAPKVAIYSIGEDSVKLLTKLYKEKENRIKVVLEGGIENVKHKVFVTSKHAIIRKDTTTKDEYIVIPQSTEECEIIVDVKTFEPFFSVRDVEKNGKIIKEIVREYPPKTYMVGYQKYEVR